MMVKNIQVRSRFRSRLTDGFTVLEVQYFEVVASKGAETR
jgi:hypothetical protein